VSLTKLVDFAGTDFIELHGGDILFFKLVLLYSSDETADFLISELFRLPLEPRRSTRGIITSPESREECSVPSQKPGDVETPENVASLEPSILHPDELDELL
jgi:hypothetical protein